MNKKKKERKDYYPHEINCGEDLNQLGKKEIPKLTELIREEDKRRKGGRR